MGDVRLEEVGHSISRQAQGDETTSHTPTSSGKDTTHQDPTHNGLGSSVAGDSLCLTCGCPGASVSVYTRVDNSEPLLTLLGHTLRRPVGGITLHSDVVCAGCHAHFTLIHRLMARLARLARQATLGFNRAARWFAKQQQQQDGVEEECLLVVDGVDVVDSEGGIVSRALAMASTARRARPPSKGAAERKFECPVCGKKFRAYSHRVEHMLVHTGERAFQCGECGFQASTKSNLARHRQRHRQECRCHLCGKSLANKFSLKEHLRTHDGERPHQCTECTKSFLRRRELRIHQRGHGMGQAQCHQCPECHKTFVLRSRLSRHMLVHGQQKQFVCNVCKKEFARKDDLKCHARIHTGEKPYSCHHCGRAFRYMSNCRSHMRVHQRLGLSCNRCNMTFPTQGKYSTHLKSRNHRRRCEAVEEAEAGLEEDPITTPTQDVSELRCGVCGLHFESLDQVSAHTLTSHMTHPILPDAPDTSIIISGMGVDGEERVVSFSQLEGVSVVVEVDRDASPLPMPLPHPSSPSTALLNGDGELPFTLDGKEEGEGVGSTILASLTDGEGMVVCASEEVEMHTDHHHITTPTTTSTSAYNNNTTITTTVSPSLQQQTVTILNSATVFKLTNWDTNE